MPRSAARSALATLGLLASSIGCSSPAGDSDRGDDPTLWITDLYEPANDPDDHYDLAVGFAVGWFDARSSLIVLDNHLGRQTGDAPAVGDIAEIVGVSPPPVVLDVDRPEQLELLRSAEDATVTIVSLGALTALNALWTAEPELVRRKVDSVIIFAGDAADDAAVEYNVQADPTAFVSVMTSRLPVRWVPAFDGGLWQAGSSSFTSTSDEELLRGVRPEVRQWFDRYIGTRLGVRNLWAAGLLADEPDGAIWIESTVRLDDNGTIDDLGIHGAVVEQLVVTDRQRFERWMVTATNAALRSL